MYLEPSQTFKMKPFVKIANGLMALTIFIKSPILDVRLGCKNATKSFKKATVSSTFLVLTTISLNIFSFYKFIFFQYLKMIFKFCCKDFYFYSNRYSHKYIRKYTNFQLRPKWNNGVWWFEKKSSSFQYEESWTCSMFSY